MNYTSYVQLHVKASSVFNNLLYDYNYNMYKIKYLYNTCEKNISMLIIIIEGIDQIIINNIYVLLLLIYNYLNTFYTTYILDNYV